MANPSCAQLRTRSGEYPRLLGVNISGDLRGLLWQACVEQRFCNAGDTNEELAYTFALPWGAVLMGVDVLLGDKQLSGCVVAKNQAEARYEEALSEGDAAIMLEQNGDRSYTLNLGNLAAGESCTITLRYAQTLQFEQGGLRLLIPTVIAPRYGNALAEGGLQPHQAPEHSITAEYPLGVQLRLHGALAQARIASPNHPVAVALAAGEDARATVTLARQACLDRDFVLVLDQLAQSSLAIAAPDYVNASHIAVLASFCPRMSASVALPSAVKILVDCSGSMAGDSLEAARRALHGIVAQLGAGERFSLSRFGSSVEHRSRGLWKVGAASRQSAARWIEALQADMGGTHMEEALRSTFALGGDAVGAGRDLLLITDGEIHAIERTLQACSSAAHRLFIVGIGSSPAESHLRRLALATGGACDFVAPGEDVEPAVLRMFARLRSAQVQGLCVAWPEGVQPLWSTPLPPTVFEGDTVNVFALFDALPRGPVQLVGAAQGAAPYVLAAAELPAELSAELLATPQPIDSLARMGASARLEASPRDAQALAVAYQLVTQRTNFLLVHERAQADKASDMPQQHRIAPMLPAGWGGVGSVRFCQPTTALTALDTGMAVPSIWRSKRTSASHSVLDDVPAFLRTMADDDAPLRPPRRKARLPDRSNPQHWAQTAHYTGLTPLGLSLWLRALTPSEWPTRYAQLQALGVGPAVLDWLELVVAQQAGGALAQEQVLAAFVRLMASDAIHQSLGATLPLWARLRGLKAGAQAAPDEGLEQVLCAALERMTASEWPLQVFQLDGVA